MPPWLEGVLTTTRQAFMALTNWSYRSVRLGPMYREAVWPMPPSSTRRSALATASWKVLARYMASTGESFSWAKGSETSTLSTSPMRILVAAGTATPAISAIFGAL